MEGQNSKIKILKVADPFKMSYRINSVIILNVLFLCEKLNLMCLNNEKIQVGKKFSWKANPNMVRPWELNES